MFVFLNYIANREYLIVLNPLFQQIDNSPHLGFRLVLPRHFGRLGNNPHIYHRLFLLRSTYQKDQNHNWKFLQHPVRQIHQVTV